MSDGPRLWSLGEDGGDYRSVYFGPADVDGTIVISVPSWAASLIVDQHNAEVRVARANRPTIVSVEAMLSRVVAEALRELIRGAMPRWTRRKRAKPVPTSGDKPVYEPTGDELAERLRELVEQWDGDHADWCCTRGCTWPGGIHVEGSVEQIITDTAMAVPCPGVCTCEVGNYVTPLRALLADTTSPAAPAIGATDEENRGAAE